MPVNSENSQADQAIPSPPGALRQRGVLTDAGEATDQIPPRGKRRGQKRRFGAAGLCNVLVTNLVLQMLLASNSVSVLAATLISQAINTGFGYTIYGKVVFQAKGLRNHQPILRYLALMTTMWLLNTAGIDIGTTLGFSKNIAAAALIPCLAVLSYGAQKYWVFK
ncbi:hypothetical protein CWE16_02590 [Synechococcus sp. BS55D]|nr:hypothetical protein CWE16_02590 [Synechococcus sp. BS55D]